MNPFREQLALLWFGVSRCGGRGEVQKRDGRVFGGFEIGIALQLQKNGQIVPAGVCGGVRENHGLRRVLDQLLA